VCEFNLLVPSNGLNNLLACLSKYMPDILSPEQRHFRYILHNICIKLVHSEKATNMKDDQKPHAFPATLHSQ
jgi:hypothetical protein